MGPGGAGGSTGEARGELEAAEEAVVHLLSRGAAVRLEGGVLPLHEVELKGHPGGGHQGEEDVKGEEPEPLPPRHGLRIPGPPFP